MNNLMTISQAAMRLNIARETLWYHVRLGRLSTSRIGPLCVISETALQEFQAQWKRRKYPRTRRRQ